MRTLKFNNREEWLEARRMRITGSRLKDIVTLRGTGKKVGFYELVAERLAIEPSGQDPAERGQELEEEAIVRFQMETGKKVDSSLVMWTLDEDENIAISPDGFIGETEAVEVKCLASSRHIEAVITEQIPSEFEFQKLQYFIVNPKLETLYFVFYDPRLISKDYFVIEVKRSEVQEDVDKYLEYQKQVLEEVNTIVTNLTF